jgi:hypothetical protein
MSLQRQINGHLYRLRLARLETRVRLLCDGRAVRSWWRIRFEGNPSLGHPLIQQAIADHEQLLEEFPNWGDQQMP